MNEAILEAFTLILVMYVIFVMEIRSTVTSLKSYYRSQFHIVKVQNMVPDPVSSPTNACLQVCG